MPGTSRDFACGLNINVHMNVSILVLARTVGSLFILMQI